MAHKITRNITKVSDIKKLGMNVTNECDLVSDGKNVYVRVGKEYRQIDNDSKPDLNNKIEENIKNLYSTKADKTALANTNQQVSGLASNKVDKGGNEQVTWGMLTQDTKENITGGNTAVVGVNSVNTSNITDKASTRNKIADSFLYNESLPDGSDLNSLTKDGVYSLVSSNDYLNCPSELQGKTSTILSFTSNYNGRFFYQLGFTDLNPGNAVMIRRVDTTSTGSTAWSNLKDVDITNIPDEVLTGSKLANSTITRSKLTSKILYNGVLTEGDINTLRDDGTYYIAGTLDNIPSGANNYGILTVENVNNFLHQTYTDLFDPSLVWKRYIQGNVDNYGTWLKLPTATEVNSTQPLYDKVVVNFGDSILGNKRGTDSVSHFISERTGATLHNLGFGGSRIAKHDTYWDAFSLYRLADEIVKDDEDISKWQLQDEAIAAGLSGMPTYFSESLDLLKKIDFSTVDYITIAGGTNDFTASVALDNDLDKYDTTTLGGSFRYSLEKIWGKYPHLKILICSPIYRAWVDENNVYIEDSEDRSYDGQYLYDFVEKEREIAKEYKTPFLDNYYELGINRYNRELYFPTWDGTHPNVTGNEKIGYKIGSKLICDF